MAEKNSEIKLFRSLRKYFQILGTFSPESDQNRSFNLRNIFVLICYIQLFVSVLAFTVFKATTLVEFGLNYYGYMTEVLCAFTILTQIYRMTDISKLIDSCEKFIEMRRHARIGYFKLIKKIEQWNKLIYCMLPAVSGPGVVSPPFLITFVNYFIYDLKEDSYFLPFPVILPFNWRTPFGYLIALLAQALATYFTLLSTASILCFLVGSSFLFISFIEDISHDLSVLNYDESVRRNQKDVFKSYCNVIQTYVHAKQFVDDFNLICRYLVFAFFLWTLSTIGSSLLVLQSESSSVSSLSSSNQVEILNIVTAFLEMFWSFAICAFFCEFGEMVTSQFNRFDDKIYRCDWYLQPIKIQKIHLIFTVNTQQPTIIRGYANIRCTREIFKMTINKGFSFYMLARQIQIMQ